MKMNLKNIMKLLRKVIPYVYQGAPLTFLSIKVVAVIYALLWFARVPTNQYMIDTVTEAIKGKATIRQVITSIVLVLAILVLGHAMNGLNAYNNMYQYYKVSGYMNYKINQIIDHMSAIEFEDITKLEQIEKAKKGYESAMLLENSFHGLVFFYLPHFLFYGAYFYKMNPALIAIIFLIFIPQIISSLFQSKYHIDLENELSPLRRKLEKYEECMIGNEMMKETRSLGAYSYFHTKYEEIQSLLHKKRIQVEMKVAFIRLALTGLTLLGYMGVIVLLLRTMLHGEISVGTFSATFMSLSTLLGVSKEIAFGTFSNLSDTFGNAINFVEFMNQKPAKKTEDIELDYSKGIQLKNISFQYPNAKRKAIDGVDLMISPGETIAIVGENGAGKSTLAKLLLGIYQPCTGEIGIGQAINKLGNAYSSHKNTSAIFQNFVKWAMTVKENVIISDITKQESAIKYINQVDFSLDSNQFIKGQDTMLAKEFDGIDLSGGQWQRLAIARGLYRSHEFIVLDEPTAAIDPMEEARMFELIRNITKDKIAVIITHRLGSVKFANRIVVLNKGKIAEEGTHEELMKLHGEYYYMFYEQAKWYER